MVNTDIYIYTDYDYLDNIVNVYTLKFNNYASQYNEKSHACSCWGHSKNTWTRKSESSLIFHTV